MVPRSLKISFRYPLLPPPPLCIYLCYPSVIMYHLIAVWPCAPFKFPRLQYPSHHCVSTACYKNSHFIYLFRKKKNSCEIARPYCHCLQLEHDVLVFGCWLFSLFKNIEVLLNALIQRTRVPLVTSLVSKGIRFK
jgi:hypothetical protein